MDISGFTNGAKKLVLASQSPRRQQLLTQLGLSFETVLPAIDESQQPHEVIIDYAKRLAYEKAVAGLQLAKSPDCLVLGADTCGEIAGQLLSKPADFADARRLLRLLSGKQHAIHTAFSLYDGRQSYTTVVTSWVSLREISETEIKAYWQSGEPQDKAGAYAIQGLGAQFVSHLSGSYSAVMGLPLYELSQAMGRWPDKLS